MLIGGAGSAHRFGHRWPFSGGLLGGGLPLVLSTGQFAPLFPSPFLLVGFAVDWTPGAAVRNPNLPGPTTTCLIFPSAAVFPPWPLSVRCFVFELVTVRFVEFQNGKEQRSVTVRFLSARSAGTPRCGVQRPRPSGAPAKAVRCPSDSLRKISRSNFWSKPKEFPGHFPASLSCP